MRSLTIPFAFAVWSAAQAPAQAETLCTLILDAPTGAVLLEEGDCHTRLTPASTFKVPLAVMGYDAEILQDAKGPVMAFRAGDPDWGGAAWTRNSGPADWMHHSIVWYSQRITHAIGAGTLTRYAQAFGYGNADFSGDPGFDNGLDRAWIASSLQVSPHEQTRFLRGLVQNTLPVRPEAMAKTRDIVEVHQAGTWVIHGKTGTAYPRRADRSFDYARGWGWYVGWAESGSRTLIFARVTQTRERTAGSAGRETRDALLQQWPALVQP